VDSVRARLEEQASIDTAELRDCFTRFDISELIANDTGVHGLLAERGWRKLAEALSATKRERILGVAATLAGSEIHRDSPEISVELRISGSVSRAVSPRSAPARSSSCGGHPLICFSSRSSAATTTRCSSARPSCTGRTS